MADCGRGGVVAVMEEDGVDVGVALEEADELGAAVAAKSDDACVEHMVDYSLL